MLNKWIGIGNLGADPELRYLPTGAAVATLNLATSRSWKDKESGERKTETEWHRVVLFNRLAEIAGEYLKKGSKIYIEGRIRTQKWQGQDGKDNYTTEIVGEEMHMLSKKGEGDDANKNHKPAAQAKANPTYQQSAPEYDEFDGDIPF